MKKITITLAMGLCAFGATEAAFTRVLQSARKHPKLAAAGMVLAAGFGASRVATAKMRSEICTPCPNALKFTTDPKGQLVLGAMARLQEHDVKITSEMEHGKLISVKLPLVYPMPSAKEVMEEMNSPLPKSLQSKLLSRFISSEKMPPYCGGQAELILTHSDARVLMCGHDRQISPCNPNCEMLDLRAVNGQLYVEQIYNEQAQRPHQPKSLKVINHSTWSDKLVRWWYGE